MDLSIDLSKFLQSLTPIPIKPYLVRRGVKPKVEYLFKVGEDHPIIARGCIQVLAGKPESGKSTFGLCLLTACACGKFGPIETARGEPIKVLWVDTEQGYSLTAEKYEQVLKMASLEGLSDTKVRERLEVLSLAEYGEPEQMKEIIKKRVGRMRPDFVFIDGVADLLEDFNNVTEARDLVRWLMALAEQNKCAVMNMIHMNKGANNAIGEKINGLQGVLGSKLGQKAQEIFIVERSGNLTTIFHEKSRNSFGKIEPLYMTATKGENQEITLDTESPLPKKIADFEKDQRNQEILIRAYRETKATKITKNSLVQTLQSSLFGFKPKQASDLVTLALSDSYKWLTLEEKGAITLNEEIVKSEENSQGEAETKTKPNKAKEDPL